MLRSLALSLSAATALISSPVLAAQSVHDGGVLPFGARELDPPAGLELPLELTTSTENPEELDQLGAAMEVAGDYLMIGVPGDGSGRVDVWFRTPGGYTFAQHLVLPASLAASDNQFGRSLAADGEVLVVGARTGNEAGHAVLFRRSGAGLYAFDKVLSPSGGSTATSFFAERLAVIEDELVAVAARGESAVHLFEANAAGQFPSTSTAVLNQVNTGTAPSLSWLTKFGSTVALHRTGAGLVSVLVGMQDACFYQNTQVQAPDEATPDAFGSTAAKTGGVAVVQKVGGAWRLDHRLIPDWSKMKDFGFEIDVEGSRVAVGALYSRVFSNGLNAGTASAYQWNGSEFALIKTTWPSQPYENGWFGYSVELRGDYLLVGQPHHSGGPQGLVEVFEITADDLVRVDLVSAPDGNGAAGAGSLGDCFGRAIASDAEGTVFIAAPFSAPPAGAPPLYAGGALYVYE